MLHFVVIAEFIHMFAKHVLVSVNDCNIRMDVSRTGFNSVNSIILLNVQQYRRVRQI
jgi:hypothetical protein